MGIRGKAVGVAACTLAVTFLLRRRNPAGDSTDLQSASIASGPRIEKALPANLASRNRSPSEERPTSRFGLWLYLLVLATLTFGAGFAYHTGYFVAGWSAWIAAMALSAFMLRGPKRRFSHLTTIVLMVIFYIQLLVAILSTTTSIDSVGSASSLLEATFYGIAVLGILLCFGATWLRGWRFTEPLAIGLMAVTIGSFCLWGLRFITAEASPLYTTGSALLFATGLPNERLGLSARMFGDQNFPGASQLYQGNERLQVSNSSSHEVHWALLVVGAARMHIPRERFTIKHASLLASGSGLNSGSVTVPSQLFYGKLDPYSGVTISGSPVGTFFDATPDKSVVSLPNYGEGRLLNLSEATRSAVVTVLGANPTYRDSLYFAAQIISAPTSPFNSIVATSRSPVQSTDTPGSLHWKVHDTEAIQYEIQDPGSTDVTNNVLYVFAVLLGVAGAGIVGALQSMVKALSAEPSEDV
jgi:hypothetical protein